MEAATWDTCRADFAFDGALIDLIVPGIGDAEWEVFWTALRAGPFELRAVRDGETIPLPKSVVWIFAERQVASVSVHVLSGAVTAICHFFGGDELLDIDPREVASEPAFESVLAIMRFAAVAIARPVLAVAECGSPAYAFLRVTSDGQAEFMLAGSVRHVEPATTDVGA